MRTLSILVPALALASTASAQDVCLGASCIEGALRDALAAERLTDVDGLALTVDAAGARHLTVSSNDLAGLERLAAASDSPVLPIKGTDAWILTMPIELSGLDVLSIDDGSPQPLVGLLLPAVQSAREGAGGGGTGGGGNDCEQVCVCTEDGYECWLVCS